MFRRLGYPLTYTEILSQVTDDIVICDLPAFPADSDEKIPIVFNLSLNDYIKLASCIDIGSDIGYPDDRLNVWQLWAGAVMCASFCDLMAECLLDPSEALQAGLAGAMTAAGDNLDGQPLSPQQIAQNMLDLSDLGVCDKDKLWGACLYFTRTLNRLTVDVLEALEVATDSLEAAGELIKMVPIVGNAIAYAVTLADTILENVSEFYVGAYTETVELELACAFFCAAQETCELDIDTAISVLEDKLGEPFDVTDIIAFITGFVGLSFAGSNLVYAMFLLAMGALRMGQRYLDANYKTLRVAFALGADQLAGDTWVIACEDCVIWEKTFDFTIDDGGWLPDVLEGQDEAEYLSGFGWSYKDVIEGGAENRRIVAIARTFDSADILDVTMTYDLVKGTFSTPSFACELIEGDEATVSLPFNATSNGDDKTFSNSNPQTTNSLGCRVRCHQSVAAFSGNAIITKIVVKGVGPEPTW